MPGYPADAVLRRARDDFLESNALRIEDYDSPTFLLKFGPIPVRLPNTKGRRKALAIHDLHHVLTGYGTDWIGEAETSAWELRGGCNSPFLYWINSSGVLLGLFLSPARVWRAFRDAKGQRTLYGDFISYESLLEMTVGDVRRRLGIPTG